MTSLPGSFLRFWWDFLVGDSLELTLGILAGVLILAIWRPPGAVAAIVVPLGIIALLCGSAWWGGSHKTR